MFKLTNFRLPAFFTLGALLLGVQASAQFEVSPDHFDNTQVKQTAHRRTAKGKANAASTANHKSQTATVAARHKGTAQKKTQPTSQQTVIAANPR